MRNVNRIIALLSVVMSMALAHAAVIVNEQTENGIETHIYHDGAYYFLNNGQLETRYAPGKDECWVINHQFEAYHKGSCKAMTEATRKAMVDAFEEQIAQMSKEEREMMAQIAKGLGGNTQSVPVTIKQVGKEKVAGFEAKKYVLSSGDTPIGEMWFSADLHTLIQKEFDLKGFSKWMQEITDEMVRIQKKYIPVEMEDQVSKALKTILENAYLVKSQSVGDENGAQFDMNSFDIITTAEVIDIEQKKSLDAAMLAIPSEYAKTASWMELMKLEMFDDE
jgi:transposase-like protein